MIEITVTGDAKSGKSAVLRVITAVMNDAGILCLMSDTAREDMPSLDGAVLALKAIPVREVMLDEVTRSKKG